MTTISTLPEACCACLPADSLALLGGLRGRADIRVRLDESSAWMYWPADDQEVLHRVLPLRGAEIFERRDGHWYRPGRHLPALEVQGDEGARPLASVLLPAVVQALVAKRGVTVLQIEFVRDDRPRPPGALCCPLADLAPWVEHATRRQMACLRAAYCPGGEVLLLGERLPPIVAGERFWGRSLLLPLGFRADPDLGEESLREALGLGGREVGLLTPAGLEVVEGRAFGPLTRAGVRLALAKATI